MSEADNVYDPLYGSFVGDQGAWSTAKMYFTVPPNGVAKLHFGAHFQAPARAAMVYELTHMRNDVRSLLQLRPKMSKPSAPAPPRPATPRPKRDLKPARVPSRPTKKGKEKSKGASPSPKPKAEWCTTYKGCEVCRRYQTGLCTKDQCHFAHVCAIVGCQQNWTGTGSGSHAAAHSGPHAPFSPLEAALTPALPYARRSEPSASPRPHTPAQASSSESPGP